MHHCLCRGGLKTPELSADDKQVRGRRENTKTGATVINRLAGVASLRAAKDVAVVPNLRERENAQKLSLLQRENSTCL